MSDTKPTSGMLRRARKRANNHRLVSIDQSFSNYAMILFEDGIPIERCVFHTGDPTTKKNKVKDPILTESEFFVDSLDQLEYLYGKVINKVSEWNPQDIVMEGLSFGSTGNMERQLGALFFGIQVSLVRELEYQKCNLHVVTPKQCKTMARSFLKESDQYEKDCHGTIVTLKSGKRRLNQMSGKKDVMKAFDRSPHAWLNDGYTRDGLVKCRVKPTGIEDLPDAYFIGLHCLEDKFNHKIIRVEDI